MAGGMNPAAPHLTALPVRNRDGLRGGWAPASRAGTSAVTAVSSAHVQ
jgi:hypothetical protein